MKIDLEKIFNKIKTYVINTLDFLTRKESSSLGSILEDHVDHQREFSASEKNMLINIVGFGESRVEDSMVPRADIIAVDIKTSAEEIIKLFSECNHSRIALYRSTLDDPIGMLHIKDFVGALSQMKIEDIKIKTLAKDILFVPPSMKSRELLLKMQASRIHMALVVDEYGGTDGLLTIENLIEEIVGEIEDEHSGSDIQKINIY
jgi:CBS domain containing-hemolysin-like protein